MESAQAMSRQHYKGRKRPRGWHRTAKEGRLWLSAIGESNSRLRIRRPKIARRYR
jgi:hypothetical protein